MQQPLFFIRLHAGIAAELEAAAVSGRDLLVRVESPRDLPARLVEHPLAGVIVALDDAAALDVRWWREVQAAAPQAALLVACRTCSDETWRRRTAAGARAVLRPPFAGLDLESELLAETVVQHVFRRHPNLPQHGKTMFRYSFPSDAQYIPGIVHMVTLLAFEFGFGRSDCTMNLPLAVDEAVSNAIVHGNRQDPRKHVEVEGSIDAGLLRLKVRDEGPGFRRDAAVPSPVDPENLLAPSGRGLYLIESVMDEVRFTQDGRCIEMLKRARPER
jgi:serine/threonine-protein kinase RsbW